MHSHLNSTRENIMMKHCEKENEADKLVLISGKMCFPVISQILYLNCTL